MLQAPDHLLPLGQQHAESCGHFFDPAVSIVPINSLPESLFETGPRLPAQEIAGSRRVGGSAEYSNGLRSIKSNGLRCEAGFCKNHLRRIDDFDMLRSTDVDGRGILDCLGGA